MGADTKLQARRLILYAALAATLLAVLFPPFEMSAMGISHSSYGLLFRGPPEYVAAKQLLGSAAPVSLSLDFPILIGTIAIIWAAFFGLRWTVLRKDPARA